MTEQSLTLPEETRVATISQQIAEIENDNQLLENEIEDDETQIAILQKAIRAKRRKQKANTARAEKMRVKRQIFAETATRLRLADMS